MTTQKQTIRGSEPQKVSEIVPVVLAKLLKITPEEAMRLILEEKRKNGKTK